MAKPTKGSWRKLKRVARYMLGIKAVKWVYKWQEEPEHCHVTADSDGGEMSRIGNPLPEGCGC